MRTSVLKLLMASLWASTLTCAHSGGFHYGCPLDTPEEAGLVSYMTRNWPRLDGGMGGTQLNLADMTPYPGPMQESDLPALLDQPFYRNTICDRLFSKDIEGITGPLAQYDLLWIYNRRREQVLKATNARKTILSDVQACSKDQTAYCREVKDFDDAIRGFVAYNMKTFPNLKQEIAKRAADQPTLIKVEYDAYKLQADLENRPEWLKALQARPEIYLLGLVALGVVTLVWWRLART